MPEPKNFFRSLAGAPVLYDRLRDSDYGVHGVSHDFHVPEDFQKALENGFEDLWAICPLGRAQTILSAGTYNDRPPSQHALGRAMDLDAIIWPERRFVTRYYPGDKVFYLAVESVLRRNFDYVLTYLYNEDHHDHFHIDLSGKLGFSHSRSKVLYIQSYCQNVLGIPATIDGHWNPDTAEGLSRAQEMLGISGDLGSLKRWREFLQAAATHAFKMALHLPEDDPHHPEVAALTETIEEGMAGHPLRKSALARVARLHQKLRTLSAAESAPQIPPQIQSIVDLAAGSKAAKHQWQPDQDLAPLGYTKGMTVIFAMAYVRLLNNDPFATDMAQAAGNPKKDAMAWYKKKFQDAQMSNAVAGPVTLRHLFVMMTGLGILESSGLHCRGIDPRADNDDGDTTEAGLFQTSYNARKGSDLLPKVFAYYNAYPGSPLLKIFQELRTGEKVKCNADDAINYGTGDAHRFQELEKEIPELAVVFAAIAFRHVGGGGPNIGHWGPINRRNVEISPDSDELYAKVQVLVDSSEDLQAALLALPWPGKTGLDSLT